jgi:hypothetical protein
VLAADKVTEDALFPADLRAQLAAEVGAEQGTADVPMPDWSNAFERGKREWVMAEGETAKQCLWRALRECEQLYGFAPWLYAVRFDGKCHDAIPESCGHLLGLPMPTCRQCVSFQVWARTKEGTQVGWTTVEPKHRWRIGEQISHLLEQYWSEGHMDTEAGQSSVLAGFEHTTAVLTRKWWHQEMQRNPLKPVQMGDRIFQVLYNLCPEDIKWHVIKGFVPQPRLVSEEARLLRWGFAGYVRNLSAAGVTAVKPVAHIPC